MRTRSALPETNWIKRNTGKPPFVDGDYFSSLFEGPKSFKVKGSSVIEEGVWKVDVRFWHDPGLEGWADSVIVINEGGRFKISDVIFSGAGPFNPPGRLSERLKLDE